MVSLVESASNQTEYAAIDRMVTRLLRPTRQQLAPVQEAIREGFNENFITESAGGTPWDQLAFDTVVERVLLGFPGAHPILQRTGNYRSSFVDGINADHISEIDYRLGEISLFEGSNDDRVPLLELGAGRVPARPVLEMSHRSIDNIGDAFLEMTDEIIHAR